MIKELACMGISLVLQTVGELTEENLERSTQSLELALSFKREEDLDRYGEKKTR